MMFYNPIQPPLLSELASKVRWGQLQACSAALALANLAKGAAQPLLIVTPDNLTAQQLSEDIGFFLGDPHNINS